LRPPVIAAVRAAVSAGGLALGERVLPEETAVAFTYDGGTYAVMMATPQDLPELALGFSLTEGIIAAPEEIIELAIIEHAIGVELRMRLSAPRRAALEARRRHMAGPTGCGLCGIESLEEALRPVARVGEGEAVAREEIMQALAALGPRQLLNLKTRAVHAAAFWQTGRGLVALREDVGRHNALDKLGGALAATGEAMPRGMVLLTSRVSVEMVQKTAALGVPVMVAVSAATALAVRTAEEANITLIAVARSDGFEIFTHPRRVATGGLQSAPRPTPSISAELPAHV
jgi:FdhD protein